MSKIAEQKALEAYPSTDRDPNGIFVQVRREDYAKGYNQAMQDFLEKAEEFLYLQLNNGSIECGNIERLIEQSKKLIEAGLDHNTADICIVNPNIEEDHYGLILSPFCDVEREYDETSLNLLPCWSLGALIGLLPKTLETKKPKNLYFPEILPSNNCVAYTALNKNKEYVFLKLFATGVESDATLIDNMVSMICWLLENNYIKKVKRIDN